MVVSEYFFIIIIAKHKGKHYSLRRVLKPGYFNFPIPKSSLNIGKAERLSETGLSLSCCVMVLYVFLCCSLYWFLYGPFCSFNLTYLHCLQHSFFDHLFNLYYTIVYIVLVLIRYNERFVYVNSYLIQLARSFVRLFLMDTSSRPTWEIFFHV